MADGNATEATAVMVDGNGNSNGQRQQQLETATAMATELAMMTEMATAIAMATATARATMTKAGLPLHVPVMCSNMAGTTPCLHPHGHKGKCIHQRCVMGVILLRMFPPFQGGGFLTAHQGFFFFSSSLGRAKNYRYQHYFVPYKISIISFHSRTTMFL
jgi:hypothetical protein